MISVRLRQNPNVFLVSASLLFDFFIGPGGQNEPVTSVSEGQRIMKDSPNEGNKLLAKELWMMWVKPRCCAGVVMTAGRNQCR